jgi:hypothetical protein
MDPGAPARILGILEARLRGGWDMILLLLPDMSGFTLPKEF